jgi:hypothetical protein
MLKYVVAQVKTWAFVCVQYIVKKNIYIYYIVITVVFMFRPTYFIWCIDLDLRFRLCVLVFWNVNSHQNVHENQREREIAVTNSLSREVKLEQN